MIRDDMYICIYHKAIIHYPQWSAFASCICQVSLCCNNLYTLYTTLLWHRTFQSFLKTTWKPGWQISTACLLWIINFYKQMWVFTFCPHVIHITFYWHFGIDIWVFVCSDNSVGRGRSRSRGAAEVTNMWQCCSLCSEVWWRISAISATLCYSYLEPFSFYWPGSQIWLGESFDPWLFLCLVWNSCLQYISSLLQLVSNAIQFLASVCERPHYKHLFEDQNILTSICEKVIVPNMEFRSK